MHGGPSMMHDSKCVYNTQYEEPYPTTQQRNAFAYELLAWSFSTVRSF